MEIFIELKKHSAFLGIEPDGKSHFRIKHLMIIFLLASCSVAMSAFFLFEAKSIIDLGTSLYGVACLALNTFTFSTNVLKRTSIFEFLTRFENMINKRSFRMEIYKKVIWRIENFTKIVYVSLVQITPLAVVMPAMFVSYWLYYIADVGSVAFKQTFPVSMPFDWRTPIGYAITVSIPFITWIFLSVSCCCVLCFLVGVCWLLIALVEDIREDIRRLNETIGNSVEFKMKLHEIIKFHAITKQFAYDFMEIYKNIITGYFLWSLSTISCSLFLVHVETFKGITNPIELFATSFEMFWAFIQIFIFCDLSQKVTDHFSELNNMVYCWDWYKFPMEMQRILPIIMISAQKPLTLTGFANLSFTREAFKKVVNGAFSYFMTIRKMYHSA